MKRSVAIKKNKKNLCIDMENSDILIEKSKVPNDVYSILTSILQRRKMTYLFYLCLFSESPEG